MNILHNPSPYTTSETCSLYFEKTCAVISQSLWHSPHGCRGGDWFSLDSVVLPKIFEDICLQGQFSLIFLSSHYLSDWWWYRSHHQDQPPSTISVLLFPLHGDQISPITKWLPYFWVHSDVHPSDVFVWEWRKRDFRRTIFLWMSCNLSPSTTLRFFDIPSHHREGLWWCREGTVNIRNRVQREGFVSSEPSRNRNRHLRHFWMNNTHVGNYSTVTLFARFLGWSTLHLSSSAQ